MRFLRLVNFKVCGIIFKYRLFFDIFEIVKETPLIEIEAFSTKYFVNLFNEVLLNDIDFSDLEKSKNITRLSFKVNEKKKNQLEFFQKILKQDYKDSLNHEISKNIICKPRKDPVESPFKIFSKTPLLSTKILATGIYPQPRT